MQLVTPAIGLVFWMGLTFSILLFILRKFAWKPILNSISEREETIHNALTQAEQATAEMLEFLKQHVPAGKSPMCGNSICQDRRFMARYMPKLEAFFHYRNVDVSTIKELAKRWQPDLMKGFVKQQAHTALADILESIEELKYYREKFFIAPIP